ncbi:MAG: VIT1/CCC1 transporter family protein [Acidimicrobiia bacterium]
MTDSAEPSQVEQVEYEAHVGTTRQYWRDIVLGVNDGLVSTFLLVAGVVGGGLTTNQVLLTAVAGAIAGAVSMAAGEYLATKSQEEVFDSEIALEKVHIRHFRDDEVAQLKGFFADLGIDGTDLDTAVELFSKDDEVLLNAMKVFEFGVAETERRSPYIAAIYSGVLFLVGASSSVIPFTFDVTPGQGLTIAAALTAVLLFAVGVIKTRVTRTNPIRSGLENLVIAGVGGLVAFAIGRFVDTNIIG